MASISKTYCDVKGCGAELHFNDGSEVEILVHRMPGTPSDKESLKWSSSPDLCEAHLTDFVNWLKDHGIELEALI